MVVNDESDDAAAVWVGRMRLAVAGARQLLAGPECFTRGALARDGKGDPLLPDEGGRVVRRSLAGALLASAAALDGERLRVREGAGRGGLEVGDVVATPTGEDLLVYVGLELAGMLRHGLDGPLPLSEAFLREVRGRGGRGLAVGLPVLAQRVSDEIGFDWVVALLDWLEQALERPRGRGGERPPEMRGGCG